MAVTMGALLDTLMDFCNDSGATINGHRKTGTHKFQLAVRVNQHVKPIVYEGDSYDEAARKLLAELVSADPQPASGETAGKA